MLRKSRAGRKHWLRTVEAFVSWIRGISWPDGGRNNWTVFKRAPGSEEILRAGKDKSFREFLYKKKQRNGTGAWRRGEMKEVFVQFLCGSIRVSSLRRWEEMGFSASGEADLRWSDGQFVYWQRKEGRIMGRDTERYAYLKTGGSESSLLIISIISGE